MQTASEYDSNTNPSEPSQDIRKSWNNLRQEITTLRQNVPNLVGPVETTRM